jgi:hypothetical protein
MPWRKRGRTIPESCADLDLEAVGRALISTGGNVSAAARALNVPAHDLRLLTFAVPELIDAALEVEERALDEAEAVLLEAVMAGTCAGGLGPLAYSCAPLRPAGAGALARRHVSSASSTPNAFATLPKKWASARSMLDPKRASRRFARPARIWNSNPGLRC